jgi:quercetin dioxygenase-like cupin family protein
LKEKGMRSLRLHPRYSVLIVGIVLGSILGVGMDRLVMAQQAGIKRTILLTTDQPGSVTHEAIMGISELRAGASSGRHRHFGVEIGYVLEGSLFLEHEGRSTVELKAGDTFRIDGPHNASNRNRDAVKVLAVYLVQKGRPLAEPVPATPEKE